MSASHLVVSGCQGTIDYRAQLSKPQFDSLGFIPPSEDEERFISGHELDRLLEALKDRGISVSSAPGGSPLISALASSRWLAEQGERCGRACFIGAAPRSIDALVSADELQVLEFASPDSAIRGTLSLEYRPASAKLMLAVPEGRRLDMALAERAVEGLKRAIDASQASALGVGIGGLNKASPEVVLDLFVEVRRLSPGCLIFVSGSSFGRSATVERPAEYWSRLLRVLGEADVVSLSATEERQLDAVWGGDWVAGIQSSGPNRLVISHAAGTASFRARQSFGAPTDIESALETARAEASKHAARALTGLGARFDGVLAAALLRSLAG